METKNAIVILPSEVQELALKVSTEKQKEVNEVLNQIFQGTADWENQVESIVVKDVNDVMSINLAETARKNAKGARLVAEKIFDSKREIVQSEMINYKLEDALWLKSKQIMQLKFKAIEEKAEFKANYVKRFEAEQKELRTQLRIEKIAKFNPEITRFEIENISDEMFSILLSGYEKSFNDKIESEKKIETDRIAKEKAEIAERERIRKENEQLKAEAEAKEKALKIEREKAAKVLAEQQAKTEKERKEVERLAKIESDKQAKILAESQAKAKAEAEAKIKAEKELKAKQLADAKIQFEKEQKEKAELAAQKLALKQPDKIKLTEWVKSTYISLPLMKTNEGAKVAADLMEKLLSFQKWANQQINNL